MVELFAHVFSEEFFECRYSTVALEDAHGFEYRKKNDLFFRLGPQEMQMKENETQGTENLEGLDQCAENNEGGNSKCNDSCIEWKNEFKDSSKLLDAFKEISPSMLYQEREYYQCLMVICYLYDEGRKEQAKLLLEKLENR